MAVVNAPLFSFNASGAIAKSLVYFPWKGLDAVRSYVVPANPQTAGQVAQRARLEAGVDMWHTLGLDSDDVDGWDRYAATRPRPQSGFNAFVAQVINFMFGGLTSAALAMLFNGGIVDSGVGQVDFTATEDGSAVTVDFLWGYSPTALTNTAIGVEVLNVWSALNVVAVSGATVYMRARARDVAVADIGWSGLYRFGPVS